MAFSWFKVEGDAADHLKMMALKAELNEPLADAYVFRLWCWTKRFAPGGSFPVTIAPQIERAIGWSGVSGGLISALIAVRLLERSEDMFEVHDWFEHQGAIVQKANRDAKLKKRMRRSNGAETALERRSNGAQMSSERRGEERRGEETRREEKREEEKRGDGKPAAGPVQSTLPGVQPPPPTVRKKSWQERLYFEVWVPERNSAVANLVQPDGLNFDPDEHVEPAPDIVFLNSAFGAMPFADIEHHETKAMCLIHMLDAFWGSATASAKVPPYPFKYFCSPGVWERALREAARANPDETVAEVHTRYEQSKGEPK